MLFTLMDKAPAHGLYGLVMNYEVVKVTLLGPQEEMHSGLAKAYFSYTVIRVLLHNCLIIHSH